MLTVTDSGWLSSQKTWRRIASSICDATRRPRAGVETGGRSGHSSPPWRAGTPPCRSARAEFHRALEHAAVEVELVVSRIDGLEEAMQLGRKTLGILEMALYLARE